METFALALLTFAVICAAPGPAVLAVVSTAMARGFAAACGLALGLTVALGVWGIVAAAGLGAVLLAAPSVLPAFKVFGGLFLLWLSWRAGRAVLRPDEASGQPPFAGFRAGLALNLMNPKAVLAWSATIALGTSPDAPWSMPFLVAAAMLISAGIYAAFAAVFSRPAMRRVHGRFRRWIDGAAASVFGFAGVGLLRDGLLSLARARGVPS